MNRLQKKCFAVTAGFHLLLVVVLLASAAFFTPQSRRDTSQPGATPIIIYSDLTLPGQTAVKTPESPLVTSTLKPSVPLAAPAQATPLPAGKINLVPVTRNVPQPPATNQREVVAKNPLRETYDQVLTDLNRHLTTGTLVAMPGLGTEAAAKYDATVKHLYEAAWLLPEDTASDDAMVKVTVTIARDGTVITSRILTPSGDAEVDRSVQRTLNRVTFVAPFPDGAKEKERTFIINFNLKAKRMLG